LGNVTFAFGLVGILAGITYGIQPYGGHTMGWTSPLVLTGLLGGTALLVAFCFIELRVSQPMFDLHLLRIRPFAFGSLATLLASIARGGLQFMLILWLQGIWLVLHGYNYADTRSGRASTCCRSRSASSSPARSRGGCRTSTALAPSPPAGCCCRRWRSAGSCSCRPTSTTWPSGCSSSWPGRAWGCSP